MHLFSALQNCVTPDEKKIILNIIESIQKFKPEFEKLEVKACETSVKFQKSKYINSDFPKNNQICFLPNLVSEKDQFILNLHWE